MADAVEQRDGAAGVWREGRRGMMRGDHAITRSPYDERREASQRIRPVKRRDRLPAVSDHRSEGLDHRRSPPATAHPCEHELELPRAPGRPASAETLQETGN